MEKIKPIEQKERIEVIDILRGFALFGILLVNMKLYNHPIQLFILPSKENLPINKFLEFFIKLLAEGKFYSLFSFLFGVGFYIQLKRFEEKNISFNSFYIRRLFILLLIGIFHGILIWPGDILSLYAIAGLFLLIFRKISNKWLIFISIILLSILPLFFLMGAFGIKMVKIYEPESMKKIEESANIYSKMVEKSYIVYSKGNFFEITRQRIHDYFSFTFFGNFFVSLNVIAMFLLGIYFIRKNIFQNIDNNLSFLKKILIFGILIGIPTNILYAYIIRFIPKNIPTFNLFLAFLGYSIGAPLLCLFYISLILILYRYECVKKLLKPLSAMGKLSLSNYLLQSIICTTLFYGYGGKLFGKLDVFYGLIITLLIFLFQLIISNLWIKKFKFGPFEYIWRVLSYKAIRF
ncbi:MAG: DUF418 domain-containing protein [candidate division WOR-3 bacterium]